MEKEKGSISPIEGFYWVIASLLCFVCYAYLGWHVTLVNLIIGVVACCSAAAFVSKNEKLSKFCADNSYAQDVFFTAVRILRNRGNDRQFFVGIAFCNLIRGNVSHS